MTPFGTTNDGQTVHAVTLSDGTLTVRLLDRGAVLHDVRLAGVDRNLTLASPDLADYEGRMNYFGALVGPVVNRIGGASAEIAGQTHTFEANQGGKHILHSASVGTYAKVWQVADHSARHVTLALTLSDGEGGFPGLRQITARFLLTTPGTLRMEVTGTTDKPTILNFANHSYWNLDGTPTWAGHSLRVEAYAYTPVGEGTIPTGEIRHVAGTPFDFRTARAITPGDATTPALDHNFCLSDQPTALREVLWLKGSSGVSLTLSTTEPGVQVYDGGHTRAPGPGLHQGLAIEAQRWPDAPHHPAFPSIVLNPGEVYRQITEWHFARD
ncbi:MAG: galactose mutarotase [Rhodobacterales bacterium]|nr:galactose mutarotase [Rhodobacterales bacterium]